VPPPRTTQMGYHTLLSYGPQGAVQMQMQIDGRGHALGAALGGAATLPIQHVAPYATQQYVAVAPAASQMQASARTAAQVPPHVMVGVPTGASFVGTSGAGTAAVSNGMQYVTYAVPKLAVAPGGMNTALGVPGVMASPTQMGGGGRGGSRRQRPAVPPPQGVPHMVASSAAASVAATAATAAAAAAAAAATAARHSSRNPHAPPSQQQSLPPHAPPSQQQSLPPHAHVTHQQQQQQQQQPQPQHQPQPPPTAAYPQYASPQPYTLAPAPTAASPQPTAGMLPPGYVLSGPQHAQPLSIQPMQYVAPPTVFITGGPTAPPMTTEAAGMPHAIPVSTSGQWAPPATANWQQAQSSAASRGP
jgi:hypothetical protein